MEQQWRWALKYQSRISEFQFPSKADISNSTDMDIARIGNAAPCQFYCWLAVFLQTLRAPFTPATKVYLFSQKCNLGVYKLNNKKKHWLKDSLFWMKLYNFFFYNCLKSLKLKSVFHQDRNAQRWIGMTTWLFHLNKIIFPPQVLKV